MSLLRGTVVAGALAASARCFLCYRLRRIVSSVGLLVVGLTPRYVCNTIMHMAHVKTKTKSTTPASTDATIPTYALDENRRVPLRVDFRRRPTTPTNRPARPAMRRTNFYFPGYLLDALRGESDCSERPMAEILRAALEAYLTDRGHEFY